MPYRHKHRPPQRPMHGPSVCWKKLSTLWSTALRSTPRATEEVSVKFCFVFFICAGFCVSVVFAFVASGAVYFGVVVVFTLVWHRDQPTNRQQQKSTFFLSFIWVCRSYITYASATEIYHAARSRRVFHTHHAQLPPTNVWANPIWCIASNDSRPAAARCIWLIEVPNQKTYTY